MHKANKTRRNSKRSGKNAKSCKRMGTDESNRFHRLAHEIRVRNKKSAKMKQRLEDTRK